MRRGQAGSRRQCNADLQRVQTTPVTRGAARGHMPYGARKVAARPCRAREVGFASRGDARASRQISFSSSGMISNRSPTRP